MDESSVIRKKNMFSKFTTVSQLTDFAGFFCLGVCPLSSVAPRRAAGDECHAAAAATGSFFRAASAQEAPSTSARQRTIGTKFPISANRYRR